MLLLTGVYFALLLQIIHGGFGPKKLYTLKMPQKLTSAKVSRVIVKPYMNIVNIIALISAEMKRNRSNATVLV